MSRGIIDLHLHFDGALDLVTAYHYAKKQALIEETCSQEDFLEKIAIKEETRNLAEYLKCFDLPIAILQTEDALEENMFALIANLHRQGLWYAEIRFAPQLHTEQGLTQKQVVAAVLRGKRRAEEAFEIKTNLILCMMMVGDGQANAKENLETLEVTRQFLGQGVVCADLAGDEEIAPLSDFRFLFEKAQEMNVPYIIHAGESGPAENVAEAMEMGALRIGHGGHCTWNAEILQQVIKAQIPLEICPTSNIQCTSQPAEYDRHAMVELVRKGAYVTLNTDNPTLSKITLQSEIDHVLKDMKLTEQQVEEMTLRSIRASFMSEEEKTEMLNRYNREKEAEVK